MRGVSEAEEARAACAQGPLACSAGGKRRACTRIRKTTYSYTARVGTTHTYTARHWGTSLVRKRHPQQSTRSSRLFSFTHLTFDSLGPPQGEARRKDLPLSETGSYLRLIDSDVGMSCRWQEEGMHKDSEEATQDSSGVNLNLKPLTPNPKL